MFQNGLVRISTFVALGCVMALSCGSNEGTNNQAENQTEDTANEPSADTEGNINATLTSSGNERTFIIHLPKDYNPSESYPLVFNFHGLTVTAAIQQNYTGMDSLADDEGFIVVYPDGLEAQTNFAGVATQWDTQFGTGTKDVAFVNDLIDYMDENYAINLKRVYATGFSNGGFMSFMLGCELSDRIAAIAPVGANIPIPQKTKCDQSYKVPVLMIHGSNDVTVVRDGTLFFESTRGSIDFFAQRSNCGLDPIVTDLPNTDPNDNSMVTKYEFVDCDQDASFVFYDVIDGGHTWPDALDIEGLVTNRDINANTIIWNFFKHIVHPNL